MKNLKSLLERFSKALNRDNVTKELIKEVVLDQTKINLKNFNYKDGVLTIEAGAAAKNEIGLKEEKIKNELLRNNLRIQRIIYK